MEGMKIFVCFAITVIFELTGGAEGLPSDGGFDVREHLSTATRYGARKTAINEFYEKPKAIPIGCTPIHLNLVARHGTRAPTKKRIKELEKLSVRLETLLKSAGHMTGEGHDLQQLPSWLRGWRCPWDGTKTGGQLTLEGEEELYNFGKRIRERFPELFVEDYHPDVYPITATQIPRASASAVAFGLGLFSGKGILGSGQHRAFAVISDSRVSDIHLRFHDTCQTYKGFKKMRKPSIDALLVHIYAEVSTSLVDRYKLNFTKEDVSSLWFLCKQEATLLDRTDQACGLFSPNEVELLEWADDFELHHLKGYGESLNYRMGVPLLQNVVQSMEQAILTDTDPLQGSLEKARLRFAHAETIIPFTCLLGLFLEISDLEKIQSEQPLQPPPKPPQQRMWRGSTVAPFAANNMLVLYKCPAKGGNSGKNISTGEQDKSFFVQMLHNEKPARMPGCNGTAFCPFEVFKEKVAGPHLKHTFESLCTIKATPRNCSSTCRLTRFFKWLFLGDGAKIDSCEDRADL
uniref:Multiple inositol polyphosphate phosphatase 1 n=1 Tax=Araucaria cunninghamii TaxID=56994 RepID=A0A0D6R654_ARACU